MDLTRGEESSLSLEPLRGYSKSHAGHILDKSCLFNFFGYSDFVVEMIRKKVMKKVFIKVILLLTCIATPSIAMDDADGFLRVPYDLVRNDKMGKMTICPVGSKAISAGCEDFVTRKVSPGVLPRELLRKMMPNVIYIGFSTGGNVGDGVVLYYKVK